MTIHALNISAFPANSMSKTSNFDITYDKYSSNYQDEIDNFDIHNVAFMDWLLFRSAHLLYASTNLHLLGCLCPPSIEVTWFVTMNINTSSAMRVLWWSIPWWNHNGLNLSTSREDNQKFGNETYRLPWYTYVNKCQTLMSTLSLKSCN
jgi:hypothetical protein